MVHDLRRTARLSSHGTVPATVRVRHAPGRIEADDGTTVLAHLEYSTAAMPNILITEVWTDQRWRRQGLASTLVDALLARFPGCDLLASDAETNTAEGNAFIDAYNRRARRRIIERMGE